MTAVNRGTGEIRIYNIDDIIERKLRKKSSDGKCSGVYDDIKSISLSLAYNCDVTISKATDGKLPIIGVGGITDTARAGEMMNAGASLVQIYSGMIYRGPFFARSIANSLIWRDSEWV